MADVPADRSGCDHITGASNPIKKLGFADAAGHRGKRSRKGHHQELSARRSERSDSLGVRIPLTRLQAVKAPEVEDKVVAGLEGERWQARHIAQPEVDRGVRLL